MGLTHKKGAQTFMDDETQVSAGEVATQEEPSEAIAQEEPSAVEPTSQEPNEVTTLREQLAQRDAELARKEEGLRAIQSAKDRREAELKAQLYRIEQQKQWEVDAEFDARLERAQDDPEESDRLIKELAERRKALRTQIFSEGQRQAAYQAGLQAQAQREYEVLMKTTEEFPLLSGQDRLTAERELLQEVGTITVPAMRKKLAAMEKARFTVDDPRIRAMEEEIKALRGSQAATNINASGGPEKPISGSSGGRVTYRTQKEARLLHAQGLITNDQMWEAKELPWE